MRNAERYPFVSSDTALGEASFRPYLPFNLETVARGTGLAIEEVQQLHQQLQQRLNESLY
jgi:hypothetical protein